LASAPRTAAERPVPPPIARLNAAPRNRPAIDLQYRGGGVPRRHRLQRIRHRPLRDIDDAAIRRDEHHVERDCRILHPHRHCPRPAIEEQHASILCQAAPVHQALGVLRVGQCYLDLEAVARAAAGFDGKRLTLEALQLDLRRGRRGHHYCGPSGHGQNQD